MVKFRNKRIRFRNCKVCEKQFRVKSDKIKRCPACIEKRRTDRLIEDFKTEKKVKIIPKGVYSNKVFRTYHEAREVRTIWD